MIVREASVGDHEAIARLYAEDDALHARGRPDVFQEPPEPRSIAFLEARLGEAEAAVFVADIDESVAGFAFVKLGRPAADAMHRPRVFAYVEEVVVASEHRRRGVGTALMRKVDQWARDRQVDQVELVVWEFNEAAQKFYEHLGFRTSHRRMFRSHRPG